MILSINATLRVSQRAKEAYILPSSLVGASLVLDVRADIGVGSLGTCPGILTGGGGLPLRDLTAAFLRPLSTPPLPPSKA